VAIGTHALIEPTVDFNSLGLVVVDEQHRFGVEQRSLLRQKGNQPHVLVLTATPIPRSLALTLYGDLDVSTITELPPGRSPIQTIWLASRRVDQAYQHIQQEVQQGHQAFIIFPIIDESEKLNLKALTSEYNHLQKIFSPCRLGLLHGRMKSQDKDKVMRDFARKQIQILAATTVVEVGIDIPEASVMLIEHAERFGLAQLHQLRGRVGRSKIPSFCYLIGNPQTEEGKKRLAIMTQTQDGFRLAEEDLALRGPGEFFGERQHGLPDLKLAHLVKDSQVIPQARRLASTLIDADPLLVNPEHQGLKEWLSKKYAYRELRSQAG
jgi:ATP-dependent DNA helicase RecG